MNEKWIFVFNKTKREKLRVTLQVIFLLQCIQQSATQIQLKGKTTSFLQNFNVCWMENVYKSKGKLRFLQVHSNVIYDVSMFH